MLKGDELKKRYEAAGYTQTGIARFCGVSQPTVWQWIQRGVPADRVHDFIAATPDAGFTPHELRPQTFRDVA